MPRKKKDTEPPAPVPPVRGRFRTKAMRDRRRAVRDRRATRRGGTIA